MAFFNDIDTSIAPPPQAVMRRHQPGATSAVLKYAPRRLRPESGDQAIANAQADARYWRERAFEAETKLRALETRVRRLAALAQGR